MVITNYCIKYSNSDYAIDKKHLINAVSTMSQYSILTIDTSGNNYNFGEVLSVLSSAFDIEYVYLGGFKSSTKVCVNLLRYPNDKSYVCFIGPSLQSISNLGLFDVDDSLSKILR